MKRITLFATVITMFCVALYIRTGNDLALTLAITFATTAYHFVMRLIVGFFINLLLNNHVDYGRRWFRVGAAELKIYDMMKVKAWKGKMPTYDPDCFDRRLHTWDEIAQAMCQAELVHEAIILFSFVPILAAIPFGAWPVFVITSVLAACYDAMFVMLQRYNRPRIIRLIERESKNSQHRRL